MNGNPCVLSDQAAILAEQDVCGLVGAGEHLPLGVFHELVEMFPEDFENAARAEAMLKQFYDAVDDSDDDQFEEDPKLE